MTAHLPLLPLPTYRNLLGSSELSLRILTENDDETCLLGHSWGKFLCRVASTGQMCVNITDISDYWSYFTRGKGHDWGATRGACISKYTILNFLKYKHFNWCDILQILSRETCIPYERWGEERVLVQTWNSHLNPSANITCTRKHLQSLQHGRHVERSVHQDHNSNSQAELGLGLADGLQERHWITGGSEKSSSVSTSNFHEKTSFVDVLQLAQPVRLLLEYTGTEYENKLYTCGEGNRLSPSHVC